MKIELMIEDKVCDIIIYHRLCENVSFEQVQGSLILSSLSQETMEQHRNDQENQQRLMNMNKNEINNQILQQNNMNEQQQQHIIK